MCLGRRLVEKKRRAWGGRSLALQNKSASAMTHGWPERVHMTIVFIA
jgi:hypothetical protein